MDVYPTKHPQRVKTSAQWPNDMGWIGSFSHQKKGLKLPRTSSMVDKASSSCCFIPWFFSRAIGLSFGLTVLKMALLELENGES